MRDTNETLTEGNSTITLVRICLVLGAGASLANALYFRPKTRKSSRPPLDTTFFETLQTRGLNLTPALRGYFRTLMRTDPSPDQLSQIRMEDFFKDLYFDFQENPNDARLRSAYTDLVTLYMLYFATRPTGFATRIAQAARSEK